MSDREKFEAWWCEHVFTPPHGGSLREYAFAAWQASRRDALEEAVKLCQVMLTSADCVKALRALSHAKEE